MPDLHWIIPVARSSIWPAAASVAPDIGFIEPLTRRRLSTLSRAGLKVAHDCAAHVPAVRLVFASRHGELRRTTDVLHTMDAGKTVSPTSFSLSVLNTMTGIFGIVRGDRTPASALSAGNETLGYALLEAYAQYATDPSSPVLLVYADEPADPAYGPVEDEVDGGALAILLDASAQTGRLECARNAASDDADTLRTSFPSQSAAVQHCLDTRASSEWHGMSSTWQWCWHEGA
ncbi:MULTISPECIES: beta-ketoacyl synthase chain length factor [unclassified Caballeronia]|jgi:hypothetical protein|uniref:beta-ketoacyl synthase chain length factor n=1 Tax=unclassified Caballeronia TaxID=2646786 RepID=UPI0020281EA4|nr:MULTISPECIES: beta-ketoacyl synthase chain length factor [unclassified Caballeronia]